MRKNDQGFQNVQGQTDATRQQTQDEGIKKQFTTNSLQILGLS